MKRFRPNRSSTRSKKGLSTLSRLDNSVAEFQQNPFFTHPTECELTCLELTGGYHMKVIDIPEFQEPSVGKLENETWTTHYHFILAALGYTVGLGNLWMFPYKMSEHGGMTFLIHYFLVLLFLGIPIFFMELVLGQYVNYGPIKIFGRLAPLFKGLGYSMVAMISCLTVYYNMINSWSIFYFASAFQSQIPWEDTNQAEEYFFKRVLQFEQNKWDDFGPIHWELALCCLASWIIVFVVIWRGVHRSQLIVMFTSLFPFICLLALCIIGFTLPGSNKGLELLWMFDVEEFKYPIVCTIISICGGVELFLKTFFSTFFQLWKDAAIQVIFSLGLLCGSLSNLARYNDFRTNCFRDTLLIVGGDVLFSLLSGLTVFLFLGFIADQDGRDVKDLVGIGIEGPTLTFIRLMDAVTKEEFPVPVPQLMVSMFSLLLLTLGLHSVYIDVETIQSALFDQFKVLRRKKVYTTFLICVVFFLLSLPYCTSGGIHLFLLMDKSAVSTNAIIIGIFEVLIVGWALGMERFFDHVSKMGMVFKTGTRLVGKICLKFFSPLLGFALLGFSVYGYFEEDSVNSTHKESKNLVVGLNCVNGTTTDEFNCNFDYPFEAEILSWLIQSFTVSFIPFFGVLAIWKKLKTGSSWKSLVQPTVNWRPAEEEDPFTFL